MGIITSVAKYLLAKYFAPIGSYEALKLDGYTSPNNGYLREILDYKIKSFSLNNHQFLQKLGIS